ncbi:MAG: hypothetical protein IJQ95_00520 [Paludibacteraceae bacterium]|nr:hypothetical protein [Paludibacteraceae bacterium]
MKKVWSVVILLCLSTAMFSQDVVLFYESFDQCIGYGTPGSDDYEDMGYTGGNDNQFSGNIATGVVLTDNQNWTDSYAYGAYQCAKVGHSKYAGYVTTPTITCTGDVVLTFRAAPWTGDSLMNIQVTGGTPDKAAFELKKNDWTTIRVNITDVTESVKIKFHSVNKHRFFLDDVTLLPPDPDEPAIRLMSSPLVELGFLGKNYTKQYANVQVVGTNLSSGITVNFTNNDGYYFAASMRSLSSEGGKLTVSFGEGAKAGTYSATIELSATGKNGAKVTKKINIGAEVSELDLEGSGTRMDPYTVGDVILLANNPGTVWAETRYWVKGYVLGAVKRYNTDQFDGICTNDKTSLVLAGAPDETNYDKVATVELVSGDARNALNVVDNPQLIGQMVKVWGELLNDKANPLYLQKPGVRNVKYNEQYVRPWDQDEPEEYDPTTKISYQQSAVSIQKIIRNGQLFIIRDNAIYTITGQIAE